MFHFIDSGVEIQGSRGLWKESHSKILYLVWKITLIRTPMLACPASFPKAPGNYNWRAPVQLYLWIRD
jgi:hypothetical protein